MIGKQNKISVLLNPDEYERFEEYCAHRGFKKSTLIARLVRDHLDHEGFRPHPRSSSEGSSPAGKGPTTGGAKDTTEFEFDVPGGTVLSRAERIGLVDRIRRRGAEFSPPPMQDRFVDGIILGDTRGSALRCASAVASDFNRFWSARSSDGEAPFDVVDLFSGCGGMSAGFRAVNSLVSAYRIIASVDIDSTANSSFRENFGFSPLEEDVSELSRNPGRLEDFLKTSGRRRNKPLIMIGCAPCQGFSSHRNSSGASDSRNSLFTDFATIAARLKPEAVIAENVPELLTDRYWPYVQEARRILSEAGYHVHLAVHNMAEFGLPQERFRALMVAMRRPFRPLSGFLRRGEFRTVRQVLGDLPKVAAGERHPDDPMHFSAGHKESTIETIRAIPKDGGSRPDDVGPECLRLAKARNGKAIYEDVYGRLSWDRPAITITAYARNPASGRFVHPEQDRGLTVREAALLQGFPKDYLFAGSLDEKFRQIGNAVPPVFSGYLAMWLLGELLDALPTADEFDRGVVRPVGPSFSRMIPSLKAGHGKGAFRASSVAGSGDGVDAVTEVRA
ncbi:MAG: DNA cytosine methyltransferase [Nitrospinae bacterium]|nr:DNA cytosine methyltransferase [Nitrospinota bacterium]